MLKDRNLKGKDLKDKTLLKFLKTPTMSDKGFKNQIGKNTDTKPFNPTGQCQPGGLFFTDMKHMYRYMSYGAWIAMIELEDEEEVYQEPCETKYKAHAIIITNIIHVKDSFLFEDMNATLKTVTNYGLALEYIKNQTPEICLVAVKENGWALKFVNQQTPDICLAAVKENGWALKFVNQQTLEVCLAAVAQNGHALEYVNQQTPDVCLTAVKTHGCALEHVQKQTPEICWAAVKQDGWALECVQKQTPEICWAAVTRNEYDLEFGWALEYVQKQTPEICWAAVRQNAWALYLVKEQPPKICWVAVTQYGYASVFMKDESMIPRKRTLIEAEVNQKTKRLCV